MTGEVERLRNKIRRQREEFRGAFFFIFLCIGEFFLTGFVDLHTWTGFIGSWIVVVFAWLLAKMVTPDSEDE